MSIGPASVTKRQRMPGRLALSHRGISCGRAFRHGSPIRGSLGCREGPGREEDRPTGWM
jgi:hypothetical protein